MIIYGASGHAKVILDCLKAQGVTVKAIFDDNPKVRKLLELDVHHNYSSELYPDEELIIAIGNNQIRKKIADKISIFNPPPLALCDPSTTISNNVHIGKGSVILHQAVIQSSTSTGKYVILNTGATVDHDCMLGDFVHIAPNTTLCGGVSVGEGTLVGAGSVVIPNIKIGKWSVIGAGSVIIEDVPDYSLVVGNPGKVIRKLD